MNWKVEERDGGFLVTNHIGDEICFERDKCIADKIVLCHNEHIRIIGFASVACITKTGRIQVLQTYGCFESFDNKIAAVSDLKKKAEIDGSIIIPDSTIFTELYGSTYSVAQKPKF